MIAAFRQRIPWSALFATYLFAGLFLLVGAMPDTAGAATRQGAASVSKPIVSAAQGTVVRWSVPGTTRCRMGGRSWAPLGETCYFPIDLEKAPGMITVARGSKGRSETARIRIEPRDYGTEEIELPAIPQANPSADDIRRNANERVLLAKVFNRKEGPASFTLPLGKPADLLPKGKNNFGVDRSFNGKAAKQPHTGSDYAIPSGAPVLAAADGTVALAQDLFYPGNSVIIDHGDGLISMYFHLSDLKVTTGQAVKKGDAVGLVGTTGRSTGPHLFFGVRWHNARVDPALVLGDPARIPAI